MRQSTKTGFTVNQGLPCFLPCRAAAVVPDPHLRLRLHPLPPCCDRVGLAEAERRAAGPPGPRLPAERRDIRRDRGRVRGRHCHSMAVRERDRRPTGRPGPEAPQGGPGREAAGHAYVVAAGTLIPVDRVTADRPFYTGKHKKHGDEPAGWHMTGTGWLIPAPGR